MFKALALSGFLLVASPAPELGARDIEIDCSLDGGKSCKISRADMEWIYNRDQAMQALIHNMADTVQKCNPKDT